MYVEMPIIQSVSDRQKETTVSTLGLKGELVLADLLECSDRSLLYNLELDADLFLSSILIPSTFLYAIDDIRDIVDRRVERDRR